MVFANSLNGEFVYDDRLQVLKNPTLSSVGNIPRMFTQSVWQFLNENDKAAVGPYYRPIFNIALIVNYQIFGFKVFGWHLFSVLLHVAVVSLVYKLALQWKLPNEVAAASALIFGLHPVHSESIAWVAALPDPLAALFILSSLLFYERHRYQRTSKRPVDLWVSAALALIAMLSKEPAVIFPLFIAAREIIDRTREEKYRETLRRAATRAAPFFAAVLIYIGMRYYVLGFLRQDEPKSLGIPFLHVLLTVPSVLLSYARMLFIPYPLAVIYGNTYVESPGEGRFWGAALAMAGLLAGAAWSIRGSTVGRRAFLLMIVFILPVLNFKALRQEESLLHDRYLYLPSIGFCILIAMAFHSLSNRLFERSREAFAAAILLIAISFFGLTYAQNYTWQNELAMTNNALEVTPRWPFLHNYIGAYYAEQRNFAEAERAYLETIRIAPRYYDALSNVADIYREQGKLREAEDHYKKAIEYGAPYADTRYNLGVTYTSLGRYEDATRALLEALAIRPSHVAARYNLGWSYAQLGRSALAEQAYTETLQYRPGYPEPRINLGVLLTGQARYDEALDQLKTAQGYAPDHPILLYALGDVLMKMKRYQEAIAPLKRLAQREPRNKMVYTSLGLCYEGLGNNAEAKLSFQKALEVAPEERYTDIAREHLARLSSL